MPNRRLRLRGGKGTYSRRRKRHGGFRGSEHSSRITTSNDTQIAKNALSEMHSLRSSSGSKVVSRRGAGLAEGVQSGSIDRPQYQVGGGIDPQDEHAVEQGEECAGSHPGLGVVVVGA